MTEWQPLHGGQLRQIAERFGIPASKLLDFSANINPDGPPAAVLSTLRASLDDLSVITNYPDLGETELRKHLSHYAGVPAENIAVANGFIPLLEAALRTLSIHRCLLPVPSFVEYRGALTHTHVEITPLILTPESKFSYDIDAMLHGSHDAILLANPQNPSGVISNREWLIDLARRASERSIYVLLDEAFIDYVPDQSLALETRNFSNLVVFRSVTKFFGMPGLRVAYMIATSDVTSQISNNLAPWAITTLSSRAVFAAVEDLEYADRTRSLNRNRRAQLQRMLEDIGIYSYPSSANFLLLRLPPSLDHNVFWERMIVEHSIVLRSCTNYEALAAGHLRVAVRSDQENERLVNAMSQVLVTCGRVVRS